MFDPDEFISSEAAPAWARIYLAGPIEVAKQTLRAHCLKEGLCVTITPNLFIYSGGEEAGYVVELVNYPRFHADQAMLDQKAEAIMEKLVIDTHQHSALVLSPTSSRWWSRRPEHKTIPALPDYESRL